jgi:hypothetical protein
MTIFSAFAPKSTIESSALNFPTEQWWWFSNLVQILAFPCHYFCMREAKERILIAAPRAPSVSNVL